MRARVRVRVKGMVRVRVRVSAVSSKSPGLSYVVGADQAAHGLQGAEGVMLAVVMAAARVPDQVAALLVGQDVRRRALGTEEGSTGAQGGALGPSHRGGVQRPRGTGRWWSPTAGRGTRDHSKVEVLP